MEYICVVTHIVILIFSVLSFVFSYILWKNQGSSYSESGVMMTACKEYVYQMLDICSTELEEQRTGENGVLSKAQRSFLENIVLRFQDLKHISKGKENAYTIQKKIIYFSPTPIMNINQFVLIHELAHIGTDEVGETPLFWRNNKYLLQIAVAYDAYTPINYKQFGYLFHNVYVDANPLFIQNIQDINKDFSHLKMSKENYTNPGFQINTSPSSYNYAVANDH